MATKQAAMARRSQALSTGINVQTQGEPTFETAIAIQAARSLQVTEPRDLEVVTERVLHEFEMGAEDMYYSWRQNDRHSTDGDGKSEIVGIGAEGANVLARNWGKCVCIPRVESESKKAWTISATFIDFESGYITTRLYLKHKDEGSAGYASQRKTDIAFSDGQSRAKRNAILEGIPVWLKKKAMAAARASAENGFKEVPLDKRISQLLKLYKRDYKISEQQLVEHIAVERKGWTEREGMMLAELYRALQNGDAKLNELFPADREPGEEG